MKLLPMSGDYPEWFQHWLMLFFFVFHVGSLLPYFPSFKEQQCNILIHRGTFLLLRSQKSPLADGGSEEHCCPEIMWSPLFLHANEVISKQIIKTYAGFMLACKALYICLEVKCTMMYIMRINWHRTVWVTWRIFTWNMLRCPDCYDALLTAGNTSCSPLHECRLVFRESNLFLLSMWCIVSSACTVPASCGFRK